MKITSHKTLNPNIEIIDISGELTGLKGTALTEYICTCLNEGRYKMLICMKRIKKIDGFNINVLAQFVAKGMQIGFFNLNYNVKIMLSLSQKESYFSVFSETDYDKVVSLFEKEIPGKKDICISGADNRSFPRVNTNISTVFKYHPSHNGVITGRAKVINLSEGGLLTANLVAANIRDEIDFQMMEGQEIHDLKFRLDKDSNFVVAKGKCVRKFENDGVLNAGIHFEDLESAYAKEINDYVQKQIKVLA